MKTSENIYNRSVKSLNNSEHYEFSGESEYSRERSDPFLMVDYLIDHGLDLHSGRLQSDECIIREIKETLARDSLIDSGKIEVSVIKGQVFLKGEVESRGIKRLAELSVENLSGVTDISNQLKVSSGIRSAT